ncbi:branched-chain amino acid ABC transporter permease [Bacillus subtilis]|uniref:branched-chain amino acid ABC transporter permease n=1 Tax=Pseudochrobactrum asaccharolyticum TaxID=354351 RepID=UPI001F3901F2|nr:branched-chain amino acid ABC transporter permease [Pseudochrobactrum asaccharolyticum]MCF7646583.1 branched-chain amino acid ABC transporter permease [Pseudochrobactrum asaccharolyticum]MCF7672722.1 branched-chain amino acid ABC transporter permease [Bacillus subtilis]
MSTSLIFQSLFAGLTNSFVYALIGIGIAVIYRGTRIINAMQGDFAVIGGMIAVFGLVSLGLPYILAFTLGLAAGAATGYLIDVLCVRPMIRRKADEEAFLLLTIGLAVAISAAVLYINGREAHLLPGIGGSGSINFAGAFISVHALFLIAIALLVVLGLWLFYRKTTTGLSMIAASVDPDGATTIGIDVNKMRALTFVMGGTIGALAGILVTPLISVSYHMGLALTLKGFSAAILGGLTNPLGAVLGGLVIGISEALAVLGLSSGYKDVVALTIMVIMMVLMPNGLLGKAGRQGG